MLRFQAGKLRRGAGQVSQVMMVTVTMMVTVMVTVTVISFPDTG